MKKLITIFTIMLGAGTFTGCMVSGGMVITPEPIVIGDPPRQKVAVKKKKHHNHRAAVRIPPGHMPSRGMCRIWYVDRPPGHQPPQGSCRSLSRRVPYNAVLVRG
ncbi:MAG: hypothetical protein JJU37_14895 [Balneolaceae bacterium]|nr:hypothetical protein [Balneolaceae bacterium]